MKSFIVVLVLFGLAGCGYSSKQNEMVGQVKKLTLQTPIICPGRVDVDVSLGVIRNGVGSMSTQDIWLTVPNHADQLVLKKAAETGEPVKVTYDVARLVWCQNDHIVTGVEITK